MCETLRPMLEPIRERRRAYEARPQPAWEILVEGSKKARRAARRPLEQVREAMHLKFDWEGKGPGPKPRGRKTVNSAGGADRGIVETHPSLHLDAYEGPLDLLLDLIRRQQIDIFNIPIARITQQYLDHLHKMEQMNVEIAGDFILMAATLIYIKSKLLLPLDPTASSQEALDPRVDLVQRLLEHEKFKNAAQMLQQKQMLEQAAWSKPDAAFAGEEGELVVTLW